MAGFWPQAGRVHALTCCTCSCSMLWAAHTRLLQHRVLAHPQIRCSYLLVVVQVRQVVVVELEARQVLAGVRPDVDARVHRRQHPESAAPAAPGKSAAANWLQAQGGTEQLPQQDSPTRVRNKLRAPSEQPAANAGRGGCLTASAAWARQ